MRPSSVRASLWIARTSWLFMAFALALAIAPAKVSHAQIGFLYEWNKPAGGAYAVNSNWTPSGIPNASNEGAYFGLNASYTVQLPASNLTVSNLEVAQGNVRLAFSAGSYTYTATGGLTVGSAGQGRLSFIGPAIGAANVTTAGTVLGQGPAGSGTVDVDGAWNSGDLIVGDAGDAEVNVGLSPFPLGRVGRLNSGSASVAAKNGSTGTVNVNAIDTSQAPFPVSEWNVTGSLAIGGDSASPGGSGRLAIAAFNVVEVGSDLKIWPGGTLSLEERGFFIVNGAANLSGALEFSLSLTAIPQLGNEFEILTAAGGVAGAFSTTMLPPLADGLRWAVDYEPTRVLLRVASDFTADFDEDGDVDSADLAQWQGDFGVNALSDADDDGDSDGGDFLQWQRQLGSGVPSTPAAVPEPGAMALAALAAISLCVHLRAPKHVARNNL